MNVQKGIWRKGWNVLKNTFLLFQRHDMGTLAGALSYFTIFSIAPVIIIVISIAGLVLGPDAIQGDIKDQVQGLMGAKSADLLQDMIKSAYQPGKNVWAGIIAIGLLVVGAIGVFGQLRTSLNTIWDVKEKAKKPLLRFFVTRLFSFTMVISLAFLLLVSLVIHALLEGFSHYLQSRFHGLSVIIFNAGNNILSLGFTWLLFALIYKFMSDARLKWRNVQWGALFTAFLFAAGKYIIGLYIGTSNIAQTYGAAGSVVVILIWVFYSSQILFFGAQFTHALAIEQGVMLDARAIMPNTEAGIKGNKVLSVSHINKHL